MSETLTPQELAKKGKAAYQRGDYLVAAADFEAAITAYQTAEDPLMAAEMANNCSVAYLQGDEPQKALDILGDSAEIFAEAGDVIRQGMSLGNRGAALEALDELEGAEEAYLESARLLEQIGEDQMRAQVMQSLSTLQFNSGRQLEALASMKTGVDGVEKPSPKQRFLKRLLKIPFEMMNKGAEQ